MPAFPPSAWRRRAIALSFGLVLAFALTELLLQGLSRVQERSRAAGDAPAFAVCQGDSNTFGLYLPSADSYPAQLEAVLAERHPGLGLRVSIAACRARRAGMSQRNCRAISRSSSRASRCCGSG